MKFRFFLFILLLTVTSAFANDLDFTLVNQTGRSFEGLYITSSESEDPWGRFGPAIAEPAPILQKAEKAKRGELSLSETKELLELLKTREQIMKLEAGEAGHEQDVTQSNKEKEEAKQDRESMKQLLKEMRELIQVLKVERQTKSDAKGK